MVGRERKKERKKESLATNEQDGWRQQRLAGRGGRVASTRLPALAVRYDSCPVHCWPTNLDEQRARERERYPTMSRPRSGTGCRVNAFQIKGKEEA